MSGYEHMDAPNHIYIHMSWKYGLNTILRLTKEQLGFFYKYFVIYLVSSKI